MITIMDNKENDVSEIISLDTVTEFLLQNNGKVKQTDLINHFRQQLSGPETKARARQEFKDILQLITAVKTENGEKNIVLIKQSKEHCNTLVTNRLQNRTLGQRKELARSKYDYTHAPTPPSQSDEEDNIPSHHQSQDSGIALESESVKSVASLRSALSNKIVGTQSMDSIDTLMAYEDEGELEEDLGLSGPVEVQPEEKDWMLASAHGHIEQLKRLVEKYPHLAKKKDFVMGYTALHWAAKLGRTDIVKFLASSGGDVSSKSHGGYTPLHLAAISGKDQVITQLIELYGANIHARDNSGKKPKDVVKDTVAADIQRKLGRSLVLEPEWITSDAILERKYSIPQSAFIVSNSPKDRNRKGSKARQESITLPI